MIDRPDWHAQAACREHHSLFLADTLTRAEERQAHQVCMTCPVLDQCSTSARTEWCAGFQAGMTERERWRRYGLGDYRQPSAAAIAHAQYGQTA